MDDISPEFAAWFRRQNIIFRVLLATPILLVFVLSLLWVWVCNFRQGRQ